MALGTQGAMARAGQTQDALKNGTAASFGSPVTDDRRLFKLRWRLPWVLVGGGGLGTMPFASGFTATSVGTPPGLALLAEPTETGGWSALIPSLAIGEADKLAQLQLGVISSSVGHATVVDRYTNSPDGTARMIGVLLEGNLAGLGGQVMVGDVLDAPSFSAARIYGRPIMWFLAPDATFQPNELDLDPRTEVTGMWVTGLTGAVDAAAPCACDAGALVWMAGWDNEGAFLDNQVVKTIVYLDLNALGASAGAAQRTGLGAHPGVQLMFDAAGFRLDAAGELNAGTDGYQARYFDRLYAIERVSSLGDVAKPKVDVERPASWGYTLRLGGGFAETVTAFIEARDQFPMDVARGGNSGQLTVGASTFLFFFGGAVTASQTGITDYLQPNLLGPGFVVTGEGRVALVANVLHLVGRAWRAHLPAGDSPDDFIVNDGATLGVEVNLDFL
ncbi:MAG: hypothetical protein A2138_02655 [Deltaproteobacteria bacterium RBG_16_71_12]|nr:MAG: hypothetical protein A2138_02655 [Deltaproteobacteria bacterium RBG_16_71_12]